jgi:hypothetical protein
LKHEDLIFKKTKIVHALNLIKTALVYLKILGISSFQITQGLGLRRAWNVNTILRFDYAVSNEDQ